MANQMQQYQGALPPAPARQQQRVQSGALAGNFTEGVRDSFPTLSFKGSKWALKYQGATTFMMDERGYAMPFIDVVLVNAAKHLSRVYYARGFSEGDVLPPDCWSVDGVKPDPGAPQIQAPTCHGCRQSVFGSKVNQATGKPAQACQQSRRIAVAFPGDLVQDRLGPVMLRTPVTSLKNLKEYADFLTSNGYDIGGVVTRISFEPSESYPKLKFAYQSVLSDQDYDASIALSSDDRVVRILQAPVEGSFAENVDEEAALAAAAQAGQGYAQTPGVGQTAAPPTAQAPRPQQPAAELNVNLAQPPQPQPQPQPQPPMNPAAYPTSGAPPYQPPQAPQGMPAIPAGMPQPAQAAPAPRQRQRRAPPAQDAAPPPMQAAPQAPLPQGNGHAAPPQFNPPSFQPAAPPQFAPPQAPAPMQGEVLPPLAPGQQAPQVQAAPAGLDQILATFMPKR